MTQPVNDDDYADDQTEAGEDLPDETDPTSIPPDQGDKGAE